MRNVHKNKVKLFLIYLILGLTSIIFVFIPLLELTLDFSNTSFAHVITVPLITLLGQFANGWTLFVSVLTLGIASAFLSEN